MSDPRQGNRAQRRAAAKALEQENKQYPEYMAEIPWREWRGRAPPGVVRVFRSRYFLVQEYEVQHAEGRLSICRTSVDPVTRRWEDGITWEQLQEIKSECGYGHLAAVEIFPPDRDVVNVANMRHLWLLARPPMFMWKADD